MNQFYCIQDAFDHIPNCLLCNHSIGGMRCLIRGAIGSTSIEYDNSGLGNCQYIITYTMVVTGYEDTYNISTKTNQISRQTKVYPDNYLAPPTSGQQYLSLHVDCEKCRKYGYVLQIIINLQPLTIDEIVFNSEKIIFQTDDFGERRELKNIYTTKQTIYSYFPKAEPGLIVEEKKQNFPLLPLDRENPTKTLKRVQNLLIFT